MADTLDRITIDKAICGGRPTIRGMRIRVTDVLELLAPARHNGAGKSRNSFETINYPQAFKTYALKPQTNLLFTYGK